MTSLECPRCAAPDVTNINHTLEGAETLSFYSCHRCEHRWWSNQDGQAVALPDVLELARRRRSGES